MSKGARKYCNSWELWRYSHNLRFAKSTLDMFVALRRTNVRSLAQNLFDLVSNICGGAGKSSRDGADSRAAHHEGGIDRLSRLHSNNARGKILFYFTIKRIKGFIDIFYYLSIALLWVFLLAKVDYAYRIVNLEIRLLTTDYLLISTSVSTNRNWGVQQLRWITMIYGKTFALP